MKQRHRITFVSFLCLLTFYASAQTYLSSKVEGPIAPLSQPQLQTPKPQQTTQKGKAPAKVVIKKALRLDQSRDLDVKVLVDSVIFFHDGTYLYCDSAHFSDISNTFEAFSNVRMEQGDSIYLYGDYMHYDGNTSLVKVRNVVRLENGKVTLFTDSLDYDRKRNIGYYFDGGMLVDEENELTSYWGQYEPNRKLAIFSDSVKLVNPKFTLYSDTLRYNTENKIATIVSPTKIVSDSGVIYTSRGWYNTHTEQSVLLDQSTIINKEEDRILKGDSIIFNRLTNFGEVFGNMHLQDTTKKIILRGHYGFYNGQTDYAFARDSAYAIEYSQKDTLFLHGDTLKLIPDSTFRMIKAYHGVRFFRNDLQGVCDSMQFNSRDSILHLFRDPILWNEGNQISGDTIDVFMNDSTIDYMHVKRYSFSIEKKDSLMFNQMKGRSMKIFMNDKRKVSRIFVEGNAESIFYPEEEDGNIIGLNWLESSYLQILFNAEGKLDKLTVWPKPIGRLTPLDILEDKQRRLTDFFWYDYIRPLNKDDIFRKVSKRAGDIPQRPKVILASEDEEE